MQDFKGKTAFITGGASGIGLGLARAFGRAGMNVVLADIEPEAAKAAAEALAAEQITAVPVIADVADRASVRAAALEAIAALGKVHVVCNNAGVSMEPAPIGQIAASDWDWTLDVNLKGVVHGVETFAPLIKSHGEGGHIVNTASLAGLLSLPGAEPYCASKFAVIAMTEGWARQLAPFGIGVSALCPGFVRTKIGRAGRNRQDRYGGSTETGFGEPGMHLLAQGIDPDLVGERVVEGVKAGELYIITDPRYAEANERRMAGVRAAFAAAEQSAVLGLVKAWPPIGGSAR